MLIHIFFATVMRKKSLPRQERQICLFVPSDEDDDILRRDPNAFCLKGIHAILRRVPDFTV